MIYLALARRLLAGTNSTLESAFSRIAVTGRRLRRTQRGLSAGGGPP
jgi:hypothetical protein